MQQQWSLAFGPWAIYRWEHPRLGTKPGADISAPDQTPLIQIPFQKGRFWQPSKMALLLPAADIAAPNQSPLRAYLFQPGGFWQPTKLTRLPAPADINPSDRPILRPYAFRRFWVPSRIGGIEVVAPPPPPPPPPDDTTPSQQRTLVVFQGPRRMKARQDPLAEYKPLRLDSAWRDHQFQDTLIALLAAGIISEEEFAMLEGTE